MTDFNFLEKLQSKFELINSKIEELNSELTTSSKRKEFLNSELEKLKSELDEVEIIEQERLERKAELEALLNNTLQHFDKVKEAASSLFDLIDSHELV
jgi:chromosome segregation ATPase